MTKKNQEDYALLLGLLLFAAILYFHWRENKQEERENKQDAAIIKTDEKVDKEDEKNPGLMQRVAKIEATLKQMAKATEKVEVPARVKQRRYNRTKKLNMVYAQPNFRNEVIK